MTNRRFVKPKANGGYNEDREFSVERPAVLLVVSDGRDNAFWKDRPFDVKTEHADLVRVPSLPQGTRW